jgi:hypothetical protein
MFQPSRGQIAQQRHNNGAIVRALPSSLSLLLLLSLDDDDDDDPASVPSPPLRSPSPPPPPPPNRDGATPTAHNPSARWMAKTYNAAIAARLGPSTPPTSSLSNDNSPPPVEFDEGVRHQRRSDERER